MQGIRGAITVENDNCEEIIESVKKLLINILEANDITAEDGAGQPYRFLL